MAFILTVFFVAQVALATDTITCPSDTSKFTKEGYYYESESREQFAYKFGECYHDATSGYKYTSDGTTLKYTSYSDGKCSKVDKEKCQKITKPEKEGIYLAGTELPKHEVYGAYYNNKECNDINTYYFLYDTSRCFEGTCRYDNNVKICTYYKYENKDNKFSQKFFTDDKCTNSTAVPSTNKQYSYDCDKCNKESDMFFKYTCSKLGNAKKDGASFVSILLLLSFIFFLF